jgi:hypothetical protein
LGVVGDCSPNPAFEPSSPYKPEHIMQKLDSAELKTGWIVHVYGRNRRLICALEPSHGWALLTGVGLGLLAAIIWFNLYTPGQHTPSQSSLPLTDKTGMPFLNID